MYGMTQYSDLFSNFDLPIDRLPLIKGEPDFPFYLHHYYDFYAILKSIFLRV